MNIRLVRNNLMHVLKSIPSTKPVAVNTLLTLPLSRWFSAAIPEL